MHLILDGTRRSKRRHQLWYQFVTSANENDLNTYESIHAHYAVIRRKITPIPDGTIQVSHRKYGNLVSICSPLILAVFKDDAQIEEYVTEASGRVTFDEKEVLFDENDELSHALSRASIRV